MLAAPIIGHDALFTLFIVGGGGGGGGENACYWPIIKQTSCRLVVRHS